MKLVPACKVIARMICLSVLTSPPLLADEPGLTGVHFHEPDFTRPDHIEVAAQVNLDTGTAHAAYARVWLGSVRFPVSGEVTFQAEADDGLVLSVAGKAVINGWRRSERAGRVTAVAGETVPLELRFFQSGGTAHCRLYWSWAGQDRVLVPAEAFTHSSADGQRAKALTAGRETLSVPAAVTDIQSPALPPLKVWTPGDWLLLDERNILSVDHLQRITGQPVRHGEPVVDGAVDGNFQPYVSVVRDTASGRWRMWYNVPKTKGNQGESSLALIESTDGIRWDRPLQLILQVKEGAVYAFSLR